MNLKFGASRNLLITSLIGLFTYGIFGLFTSPLVFWIFYKLFFIKSSKITSIWSLWFAIGTVSLFYQPPNEIGIRKFPPNDAYDPQVISIQNLLTNGIKECIVRDAEGLSTNFSDVSSFNKKTLFFEIEKSDTLSFSNTCFSAKSKQYKFDYFNPFHPISPFKNVPTYPIYQINLNPETGLIRKICKNRSQYSFDGCEEKNTW